MTDADVTAAQAELDRLRERANQVRAEGGTAYNPGWHLALDLRNIMLIADCVAWPRPPWNGRKAAAGTRDDFPGMSPQ